jgi:hypothetical protein
LIQSINAKLSIDINVVGICKVLRCLQFKNANDLIYLTFSDIPTPTKLIQFLNVLFSITSTLYGILVETKEKQLVKALGPIYDTVLGRVNVCSLIQC